MISWAGGDKMRPAIEESALDEAVRRFPWRVQYVRRHGADHPASYDAMASVENEIVAEYRRIVRERQRV